MNNNIPLTYLATPQPEEVYIRRDDKEYQRIAQECDAIAMDIASKLQRRQQRRARNQAMRDLGLVRVKGALGGTYWE